MAFKYAQALLWCDAETTDLPGPKNDYSRAHILEVAFLVTDFDLNPIEGYHEVIKMTKEAADSLRANDYTREMHKKNGLIKDSMASTFTLADVEAQVIEMLQQGTSFEPGEFMLAGSGNAAFDRPLLNHWMPNLVKWLAYYPFDVGVLRRTSKLLSGGRDVINVPPESAGFGDAKLHRAWGDVQAHLEEAKRFQEFFQNATQ